MAAQKGSLFVLKVGDGASPEVFATVGGLRITAMTINNGQVEITNKGSGGARELLAAAGIQAMSIAGSGVFTDVAAEETVRSYAAANSINNFEIVAGNGDKWEGAFLITSYERGGDHNSEETFGIRLESSGAVTFTAGS